MAYGYTDHNFDEMGDLASQCNTCNLPFSYAVTHQEWPGHECKPYTREEQFAIHGKWIAYTDSMTFSERNLLND